MFGSAATGGAAEIVTLNTRSAGDTDGQTGDDVEYWSHGCMAYRPADPTGDGKCQVMTRQVGGRKIAVASQDSRAKVFGALNKGDACFGSPTGGGMFRANADGSTGFRRVMKDGAADAYVNIEADGTIVFGNQWGQAELGENGWVVALKDSSFEQLSAKTGFVVSAPTCSLACGSVALGMGATKPLAAAPITGTVGTGFVAVAPVLNVFVP